MVLQEIYEKQGEYYTKYFPGYEKQVKRFMDAIKNNTCDDEVKKDLIYTKDNHIAGVGQGTIPNTNDNPHYNNLLARWGELYSILKNILDANDCTNEQFNQIRQIFKECCDKEKTVAPNRTIAALLPNVLTTTVKEKDFYPVLDKMKSIFDDYPPITKNWLSDNKKFIEYVNQNVKFKHPWHSSIFAWCLKEYFGNKQKEQQKEMDKIDDYKKLLEANKNLILHGAPGTGKTHTAKDIAAQMICGKLYAEVEKDEALNKQFNEQTEFVQFHPSYDYSDFVEGLRPIEGDNRGDVGFERKDGVFKEFCKRALKAKDVQKAQNEMTLSQNEKSDSNENTFDIDILLNRFKEDVEKADGPILIPYTDRSKAFEITGIKSNGSFSIELENGSRQSTKEEDVRYTLETGERKPKQTYSYCIARYIKEKYNLSDYKENFIDPEDNITDNKKKNFIFIIDEINRGEMSKIFGELFFSIDPDYRGTKGKVRTQYANMLKASNDFDDALGITTSYGHFFVPENVYIIGTMNDIDRSVDSMDFAMRRRFTFMELKANECLAMLDSLQLSDGISKDDIIAKMTALNSEIEKIPGLSSAYHIGGSYFAKLSKYADKPKDEAYKYLWNNHLKPLLTDYLRGLPNLEAKLSSFKTKYDEAEFVAPKNSDD